MRMLMVVALALAGGCTLVTDFDRSFTGQADATPPEDAQVVDAALSLDQECLRGCAEVVACARELVAAGDLGCTGLDFTDDVVIFDAYCVSECRASKTSPAPRECRLSAMSGWVRRYAEAWDDLCEAERPLCDELCRDTGLGAVTTLVRCGGADPVAAVRDCPRACDDVANSVWACIGAAEYQAEALGEDPDQCELLRTCADR